MSDQRYNLRGVSASKEDVHLAISNIDKGIFPQAFCKIIPDILGKDPDYCNIMHADGAGTKSSLAYAYWKETGDISVWRGIAQDAIIMNTDDLLCVGAVDNILLSSTIGRNKNLIPGEVIAAIINALLTILSNNQDSESNLLFYLFSYGFSVIALITIAIIINDSEDRLEAFKGLAKRNPVLGFVAVLALLSLAGVPPLVGFFGKYLVFSNAISEFPTLVIIAIINSGIGIYYYLKTVITVVSKDELPEGHTKLEVTGIQWFVLAVCAFGLLFGGYFTTCLG